MPRLWGAHVARTSVGQQVNAKDEIEFMLDALLRAEIPDNGRRWYVIHRIMADVVVPAQDAVREQLNPFIFAKPAD